MDTRANSISGVTWRNILDYLLMENIAWSGRLDEPDFVVRVWPDAGTYACSRPLRACLRCTEAEWVKMNVWRGTTGGPMASPSFAIRSTRGGDHPNAAHWVLCSHIGLYIIASRL